MTGYMKFLRTKIQVATESGFEIDPSELNPALKPHQRDAVRWALRGGRRALFESFGLGKTVQELEFCYQAVRREGGQALIVLPLGVRQEFIRDAVELLGYAPPVYVTTMAQVEESQAEILMTNYEHVQLSKELENREAISKEFMTLPPVSHSPDVWDDVNRMKTLNTDQSRNRAQLHVCPLQLDIVERIITRYSNPGELVLDPFGGLGTVALMALRLGRKGYSIELNPEYFQDAVAYLQGEEEKYEGPTLFDLLGQA